MNMTPGEQGEAGGGANKKEGGMNWAKCIRLVF